MSYAELLKDPRWQKKRLEILDRDEWTCQRCRDTKATLTVHHKSYRMIGGAFVDIWDYPGEWLITLCEDCHSKEEAELDRLKKSFYFYVRTYCEDAEAIAAIANMVRIYCESQLSGTGKMTKEDVGKIISAVSNDNMCHFLSESVRLGLRSYVKDVASHATETGDNASSAVVDCCNFILIEDARLRGGMGGCDEG